MTVRLLAACLFIAALAIAQPQSLASIEGTLVGANHLPLAGTEVLLHAVLTSGQPDSQNSPVATTDTFGRFSFQGLRPGAYYFIAFHFGYVPFNSFLAGARLGAPPLTLTAGQHKADVVIEMVPLTVLSGKVTDEDGDPMPGVTVRALRPAITVNGRLRIASAGRGFQTDAEGKYELTVDPGHWYLSFSTPRPESDKPESAPDEPERGYVTTYYPGTRELSVASYINAPAGQQMTELNVKLQKTLVYHVRGKIAGSPPNIRVIATQEAGDVHADRADDGNPVQADGTFEIRGLAPGVWTLSLMQAKTRDLFGSRTVKVTDRDLEDIAIAVLPPADLSGSVKVIAGRQSGANPPQSLGSLQVHLESLDAPGSQDAPIGSDGTFTVKDVEAGKYRVEVIPLAGGFVKSVTFDGRECIDSGIEFIGGAGDSQLQIVVSMNTGQITGTVTNPDGDAPAGSRAVVTLVPDGSPGALYRWELNLFTGTGSGGQFTVKNVVPGTYRVYAWERLDPLSDGPRNGDPIVFADPGFPRLFDDMSAVVTVGENESKQVSLTLISAARMDEESRRLH